MGVIINTLLVAFATVVLVMGISFFIREKTAGIFRRFLLLLGIFGACWAGGYGVMGYVETVSLAYIPRAVGLFGVLGFITTELVLVLKMINMSPRKYKICMAISISIAALDFAAYGAPSVNRYVRIGTRTAYYSMPSAAKDVHFIYLGSIIICMITLAIYWYKVTRYKREAQFILCAVIANAAVVIATVTDTILPVFNMPSFPGTAFGVTVTYVLLWIFAVRYNAFNISVRNLSNYIYDSVNAAILVFDENYELSLANSAAMRLMNIDSIEGKQLSDMFEIDEEKSEIYMKLLLRDGACELKTITKDGGVSCSLNMSVINDNNGDPYCIICFVYDLTMEENMIREISQANKAKSAFLANMSHEIRTPINAILGMDEIILRESQEPDIVKYASIIDNAGKNLLTLVNDILDFSKIESGKMEILSNEYEIASLINDSYSMINLRAMEKNLDITLDNEQDIPSRLIGDERKIRQILINLLSNAVKYTPEGRVTMSLNWDKMDDENIILIISVEDTGIGMSQQGMDTLFDSFKRIDEDKNRDIEGTGLGMTITKQMVTNMNGSISVESELGKGTKFTVEIPQKVADWQPGGDFSANYSASQIVEYKEKFRAPMARIMVVDDVSMNIQVFAGLLKKTQIQIESALSGQECLDMVRQKKYDIIFMDHMMPKMDGVETFRKMAELEGNLNRETPVIMLTANAIMGMEEDFKKKGFTDFMSKPIKGNDLEKMVMNYLPSALMNEITNLDFTTGMEYCGDNRDFYLEMLQVYVKADKRQDIEEKYSNEDWGNYRILIHALKSTSLSIGAGELSESARKLEQAAKDGDYSYIKNNHSQTMEEYGTLLYKINGLVLLYQKESNI